MHASLIALFLGASLLAPAHAGPVGAPAGHLDGAAASRTNDHWSGYSAHSGAYSSVSASWTEPTVDCRAGDVSAEVITETPIYSNGPSALANFGAVTYTDVTVDGRPLGNSGPQAIDMARHGRTIDTTSAISGGNRFGNTWLASS